MKQDNRAYAKRLMVHYFKTVWPESETWHSDNQVELELLVDAIIDAAVDEVVRCVGVRWVKEKED